LELRTWQAVKIASDSTLMLSAPDLSATVPRSPFDELAGYAWLPRLIDKARAQYAGTRGEYSAYPCPGDRGFLGFFKLDPKALGQKIESGADDEVIASYVCANAKGDQAAFRNSLRNPSKNPILMIALYVMRRNLRKRLGGTRQDIDWSQVDSISKLLAVEEGHPLPS
jgi:hypothetical protein